MDMVWPEEWQEPSGLETAGCWRVHLKAWGDGPQRSWTAPAECGVVTVMRQRESSIMLASE